MTFDTKPCVASVCEMADLNHAAMSHKGEKKRSYSMSFKSEAIEYAERVSNRAAAAKYKVDIKRVREWRQNKESIEGLKAKPKGQTRERLDGGGRKVLMEELDELLLEWIYGRRENGLRVSRKLIMVKAKHMYDERCLEGDKDLFKATTGWLHKFMKRNGLSLRRKTTTAQQEPSRLIDKLISYILQVRRLSKQRSYQPCNIIAMDETPVWDDMVSDTTVDKVGKKSVNLKTTGHEKVMVTVCLAAKADGTKLKPFIVFRGAKRESKALDEEYKHKCVVNTSSNAWMNEELTLTWVQKVLGAFSFSRRMLAWDSFECHMTQSVKEELWKKGVDQVIVPGGCTKFVQAPDVCWNKPFKALVTEQYDEWMASGVQEYTESGNMRPPSRKMIVEWVLNAWSHLSTDLIVKSFKACALNLNVDGSEDSAIHCFKERQPCQAGAQQLKSQLSVLEEPNRPNPFLDITDSDIDEANEMNMPLVDDDLDEIDDEVDIEAY